MSATGRGGERIDQDAYFTPHPFTYGIVPALFSGAGHAFRALPVIDPACGTGQILQPLRRLGFTPSQLFGFELNPTFATEAGASTGAAVQTCNTLNTLKDWRPPCPVTILMNPPYSLAFEFCKWAVEVATACNGQVAAFLRINFLASAERESFFEEHPPFVGVTSRRPCFVKFKKRQPKTGKIVTTSSDATEYAWICWRPGDVNSFGRIFWIPTKEAPLRARLAAYGFTAPADLRGPPAPIVDLTDAA